ncbi:MAG TPA: HAMP domain-containing sensor histidine kinase [Candidatus Acidoferrales bacterium]|nr:HAMP domain-containing sensor histidine kinase [Candidatus Acidoferrales bacterium]
MQLHERYLLQKGSREEDIKKAFLIFRWLLIIVCSTMVVFSEKLLVDMLWAHAFVILILLSNAALHLLPARIVTRQAFYSVIALADIALITLALIISGQTATDFYLLYFLVLIISALSRQMTRVVISTVLVILLYGLTLLLTGTDQGTIDPVVLLRFPFFFIIALFYGFLVQSVHDEKQREERIAQDEVNRIKAQFLGSITHELLGPINMIMGNIHLMLTGAAGNLTLEQIKIMDQFQLHAERLLKYIRELVELSNIETKRLELRVRRGEIKPFLKDLEIEVEPRLKDKPVRAQFLSSDDFPRVETDWITFRHAMLHILATAINSTEAGQITVLAQRGDNPEEATLAIVNTSSGIDKQVVPEVVEKMLKSGAASYQENGYGVGLAIAKNLLDLLGARLQVAPATKGSDFLVTLPVNWGARPKKVVGLTYTEPFTKHH